MARLPGFELVASDKELAPVRVVIVDPAASVIAPVFIRARISVFHLRAILPGPLNETVVVVGVLIVVVVDVVVVYDAILVGVVIVVVVIVVVIVVIVLVFEFVDCEGAVVPDGDVDAVSIVIMDFEGAVVPDGDVDAIILL